MNQFGSNLNRIHTIKCIKNNIKMSKIAAKMLDKMADQNFDWL